ncbi:MAG: FtsX-like permease family protein [Bacillota bacterium]
MRRNVCLKSSARQPIRTLVLVLLVGAISFAFVSRAVEYLVVIRETDRLAGYYRSIGSLEGITADDRRVSQAVELVSNSPYVAFEDRRRYCAGVLQGIYNSDVDGWSGSMRCSDVLFYGKLLSKAHLPEKRGRSEEYQFNFAVDTVVAGYPEYFPEDGEVTLGFFPDDTGFSDRVLGYIPGESELEKIYDSFEIGERYMVRGRIEPLRRRFSTRAGLDDYADVLTIQPLIAGGTWFNKVEPGASVDFTDPSLTGLTDELAVIRENQHTMSVYGTADMSAMPDAQESSRWLYLIKGRWLDAEDNAEGRRVCVVHNDFAVRRGLSAGDKITLKLREMTERRVWFTAGHYGDSLSRVAVVHPGYIIQGEDSNAWQDYRTCTKEFEIVGLYNILWDMQSSFFSTEMYIPDSCMPQGYCPREHTDLSLYSFVLDSPDHEDDFLAENRQALEDLGIEVRFVETGWHNFQAAAIPLKRSLATTARVFSAILVPTMALASFLYLWQRKRDFAILRSLGVPRAEGIRQLVWCMSVIGVIGVAEGGALSWGYALRKAVKTLASLQGPKGAGPAANVSPVWLAGLCAVALAVLLSFTVAGALVMSRRPVLALLQGAESRAVRKRKPAADGATESRGESEAERSFARQGAIVHPAGEARVSKDPGRAMSSRYIFKHLLRAPQKSALTVVVALGFTLALGWLSWSMERNEGNLDELYRVTEVEAEIVRIDPRLMTDAWGGGFIPSEKVDAVLETGFVKDAYLAATARARTVGAFVSGVASKRDYGRTVSEVPLVGYSQPKRAFLSTHDRTDTGAVEYATGWDESLFSKEWTQDEIAAGEVPVVLHAATMRQLRLGLGDCVWLQNSTATGSMNCKIAGQYTGVGTAAGPEAPILLPLSALTAFETDTLHYLTARFAIDPGRNRELPEFRAKVNEIFGVAEGEVAGTTLKVWDEQMRQVVEPMERNLLLVRILRSVTIAVSVLIAAGLGALMVLQRAKEAAIMRVLGVTRHLVRSALCGEQMLLCVLGLVLGLASFAIVRGQVSTAFSGRALGCAALYLGGCLVGSWQGARSVTNRPPLELLQVKE